MPRGVYLPDMKKLLIYGFVGVITFAAGYNINILYFSGESPAQPLYSVIKCIQETTVSPKGFPISAGCGIIVRVMEGRRQDGRIVEDTTA